MFDLKGKVALVTGGTGGLGSRICNAFAREGARIAIVYQSNHERAAEVKREVEAAGGSGALFACDVTDRVAVEALVDRVVAECGGLDVLVNNAGFNQFVPFNDLEGLSPELFEKILHYNTTAPFYLSRKAGLLMRKQGAGRIVNIASIAGFQPTGSSIAYAVSKAALIHLTRCLAKGLAPEVTVNCVAPGLMEGTRMTARLPEAMVASGRQSSWLHTAADKEDVAAQCVAFARSDTTTGQTVAIDAGVFAH
jgi:3-oxoacyl-[acyl-carrier protein] reductase